MNSTFKVMSIALIFVNLTSSKPIEQMDLELETPETESQYSNQIHLIVKRLTNGGKSTSHTGYASIITTEETKNHKKKRHCEEWIKIPITNEYKCTKFKVLPNDHGPVIIPDTQKPNYNGPIIFPDSPIIGLLKEDHPYKEQVVNRHKTTD